MSVLKMLVYGYQRGNKWYFARKRFYLYLVLKISIDIVHYQRLAKAGIPPPITGTPPPITLQLYTKVNSLTGHRKHRRFASNYEETVGRENNVGQETVKASIPAWYSQEYLTELKICVCVYVATDLYIYIYRGAMQRKRRQGQRERR